MNNNRVNGTIDEVVGSAKRKAGELIGNPKLQVKGIAQQAKGKVEGVLGKATDAVRKASENGEVHVDTHVNLKVNKSTRGVERNKCK